MVAAASILAIIVLSLPVVVMFLARARRNRELWEVALDVPFAVALDLLLVLLLSRLFRLETAALVARVVWLVGGGAVVWRRRRATDYGWPRRLDLRLIVVVGLAVAAAVAISMSFSRQCHGFDRGWHIPLATSLRGQTLPFANVYEPGEPLAYHFTGDVLAAMAQTYSGNVIHTSLALSVAHDVMYGLAAGALTLLAWWLGVHSVFAAFVALSPLLASPLRVFAPKGSTEGYNFINLLKIGFRPHSAIAMVLMIGFSGAVLARIRRASPPPTISTAGPLVACTALLAVTDEASTGILGISLGLVWLFAPSVVADSRKQGLALFVVLLLAVVGSNVVFSGALMNDASQAVSWVPARAPGYYKPPLPLTSPQGMTVLARDLLTVAVIGVGGLLHLLSGRWREAPAFAWWLVLTALSVLLLTHVDMGERSLESHRFFTAALFLTPVLGIAWLTQERRSVLEMLGAGAVVAGMALMILSSLDWLSREGHPGSGRCPKARLYFAKQKLFEVNCRRDAHARFGEVPVIRYFDPSVAYLVSGCRPTYAARNETKLVPGDRLDLPKGRKVRAWTVRNGRMIVGPEAVTDLHATWLAEGEPLRLVCPERQGDAVCRRAKARADVQCDGFAPGILECTLPAGSRDAFVAEFGLVNPTP